MQTSLQISPPKEHLQKPKSSGNYADTKHQGRFKIHDDLTSKLHRYKIKPKSTQNKTVKAERCLDDPVLIDSCKPLVEDVKKSLRNLEVSIDQAGDQPRLQASESKNRSETKNKVTSKIANSGDTQQIYTTTNTFGHLKNLLYCENRNDQGEEEEKSRRPCFCQRCGMVSLLIDSQKRPIMVDVPGSDLRMPQRRVESFVKADSIRRHSSNVIVNLVDRVGDLEMRMDQQEQRGVSKEYFRKVITRLFDQLKPQVLSRPSTRNNSTQDRRTYKNTDDMEYFRSKYWLYGHQPQIYRQSESSAIPRPVTKLGKVKKSEVSEDGNVLFWGTEPIRHGFDLKSKISRLVEEKFVKLFKARLDNKKSSSTKNLVATNQQGLSEHKKNSKNVFKQKQNLKIISLEPLEIGGTTFKKEKQQSRASMIPRYKFPVKTYCNYTCSSLFNKPKSPDGESCKGEHVHVAYVNPAVVCWAKYESDPSNDEQVNNNMRRLKVLEGFDKEESWEEERKETIRM